MRYKRPRRFASSSIADPALAPSAAGNYSLQIREYISYTKACALGRATGAGPRRARRAAGGDPGGLVVGDDLVLVITRAYHVVVHVAANVATVARARHALFLAVLLAAEGLGLLAVAISSHRRRSVSTRCAKRTVDIRVDAKRF